VDFVELEMLLSDLAGALCGTSLTITKLVETPDGYEVAEGVPFTADPQAGSGFDWVLPAAGPADARTVSTDANGRAQFQWSVTSAASWGAGTVDVTETAQPGYQLEPQVSCTRNNDGVAFTVLADVATSTFSVDLAPGDTLTCEVRNTIAADPPDVDICTYFAGNTAPAAGGPAGFNVILSNDGHEAAYLVSIEDSVLGNILDPGNTAVRDGDCTDTLGASGSYSCYWNVLVPAGTPGDTRVHTTSVTFINDAGIAATAVYETTVTLE